MSKAKGHPADDFYPCNEREAEILRTLKGEKLERYIELRHGGATVTEALEAVGGL